MAAIAPFRGIRPAPGRRGPTWPVGSGRAVEPTHLQHAIANGHLVRDRTAGLYRYELTFGPAGARRRATAFLARMALEGDTGGQDGTGKRDDGGDADPASSGVDAEPVVFRYGDERGWVDEVLASNAFDEVVRLTDADGNVHRVWRVDRAEGVQEVVAQFEDRPLRVERGQGAWDGAVAAWRDTGAGPGSVLVLLAPEGPEEAGPEAAPWLAGLVLSPRDEPRPRPWQGLAGGPGKPSWKRPPLG